MKQFRGAVASVWDDSIEPDDQVMGLINALPQRRGKKPLAADQVIVGSVYGMNTLPMKPPYEHGAFDADALVQTASLCAGKPFNLGHFDRKATGMKAQPAGRLFRGAVVADAPVDGTDIGPA